MDSYYLKVKLKTTKYIPVAFIYRLGQKLANYFIC